MNWVKRASLYTVAWIAFLFIFSYIATLFISYHPLPDGGLTVSERSKMVGEVVANGLMFGIAIIWIYEFIRSKRLSSDNKLKNDKPIGLYLWAIFFIVIGTLGSVHHIINISNIQAKEQVVANMEKEVEKSELLQDSKFTKLQIEYLIAFKNYKESNVDYFFEIISFFSAMILFGLGIAILMNKKWTIFAINMYVFFTFIEELVEYSVFAFLKIRPNHQMIEYPNIQKIILFFMGFFPILIIGILILLYFNRKKIIKILSS